MDFRSRLKNNSTYTDDGISPALPVTISGFGSGFWVVVARQGGSGGLTGGRMMVGFSPGGRTMLKLSESPGKENNKNLDSEPNGTLLLSRYPILQLSWPPPLVPISFW